MMQALEHDHNFVRYPPLNVLLDLLSWAVMLYHIVFDFYHHVLYLIILCVGHSFNAANFELFPQEKK